MNAIVATFLRELKAYFFSPLAYVVLFFFLVVNGAVFALIVNYLNNPLAEAGRPFDIFFGGSIFFWLILLFATPVLTMRLIAEERKSGSIEVLMTAPVTEDQVVIGKYLAAFAFYCFLWLPTVLYAVIVDRASDIDWGTIASGYLGIALIGGFFLALGVLGSAMSRNQIVAAIISFALSLLVFVLVFLPGLVNDPGLQQLFSYVSVVEHMDEFARGIVDTRRLVFYLSTTVFLLYLASRTLEEKKWR
ncbi:MAG: ABC transporter permease subunit [Acidobacteriota bacterium]